MAASADDNRGVCSGGNKMERYFSLVGDLKALSAKMRSADERESVTPETFQHLSMVIGSSDDLEVLTECFRCLRNSCADCARNQKLCIECPDLLSGTVQLLTKLLNLAESDQDYLCMSCGVQFLGNLVTGCSDNQNIVVEHLWNHFTPLIKSCNEKVSNYTCMVLYNCLNDDLTCRLSTSTDGKQILKAVFSVVANRENSDWGMYICQSALEKTAVVTEIYPELDDMGRLLLLDILLTKNEQAPIQIELLQYLARRFTGIAHIILGTSQREIVEDLEPRVATKLLSLLCSATASAECRALLDDQKLLECAVNLLHGVHLIGKSDQNPFTAASKAETNVTESGNDVTHPAFGLRRDLVRLVGNMCYQHPANQDRVREMGGVQLLLNQSAIDHKNPYITQWSVLAIRNLCENNPENQAIIAEMQIQGVANQIDMLRDFGVDAYEQDGKVKIRRIEER